MSNLTILQQKVLLQFETTFAQEAFLWACTRRDADRYQYAAEAYAREVEQLVSASDPMLALAALPFAEDWSNEKQEDLLRFILKRHLHWRFPDAKDGWL